ncbi:MAG TPA: GMC family oxidoreductase [Gemmatimonadaceae bacterium]|nr:GMC family oxidoreductase [Gemmatimonadaceae bacterium]
MSRGVRQQPSVRYAPADEVDFAIVGAGAAGSVMARELSRAGYRVVVLEQGSYLTAKDFKHDELAVSAGHQLTNHPDRSPQTFRASAKEKAARRDFLIYGRVVGGGSVHFTANYWRFHEADFLEHSRYGNVAGANLADWPIRYADLEPYYTKVEWEVGVSGAAGSNPFDPPRSRPFPLPPMPIKPSGVLLEVAARKLGWHAAVAPVAVISQPYRGRQACQHCGFCENFGCEWGAKSSALATMIPDAEATGRCEIRPNSYVRRVQTDARGLATGVVYFDVSRREIMQRAKAVIVSANGAETPRLLFMSATNRFRDGLANSSGYLGKHLMFNGGAFAGGVFDHELNGHKGVQVSRYVQDHYRLDPKLGIVGGGGIDTRFDWYPISFAMDGIPPDAPHWGAGYKRMLREYYTRSMYALAHTTQLPQESANVTLDPELKDAWGLPAIRTTFTEHPNDIKMYQYFLDRCIELLDAAGAKSTWKYSIDIPSAVHLLGTARMGNDPKTSVVDKFHRTHDVPNLFIVDGSSFVTSGSGQPTMTIQALAFRAAEAIAGYAKRGEITRKV